MKRMRGYDVAETEVKRGQLKGGWEIKQIDAPNMKGYVIRGRFGSDPPVAPFDPLTPNDPLERRPMPQRSFRPSAFASNETREPLTDVFEEAKAVKIYVELPGEAKEGVQLNVTQGKVEVKAQNFYKMIEVPRNLDVEKASSQYNNGVLTIILPKDAMRPDDDTRRITID